MNVQHMSTEEIRAALGRLEAWMVRDMKHPDDLPMIKVYRDELRRRAESPRANPFKSEAQRRKFYAMEARGEIAPGTTARWEKNPRALPPAENSYVLVASDNRGWFIEQYAPGGAYAGRIAGPLDDKVVATRIAREYADGALQVYVEDEPGPVDATRWSAKPPWGDTEAVKTRHNPAQEHSIGDEVMYDGVRCVVVGFDPEDGTYTIEDPHGTRWADVEIDDEDDEDDEDDDEPEKNPGSYDVDDHVGYDGEQYVIYSHDGEDDDGEHWYTIEDAHGNRLSVPESDLEDA